MMEHPKSFPPLSAFVIRGVQRAGKNLPETFDRARDSRIIPGRFFEIVIVDDGLVKVETVAVLKAMHVPNPRAVQSQHHGGKDCRPLTAGLRAYYE
jgi:hypothetical protein